MTKNTKRLTDNVLTIPLQAPATLSPETRQAIAQRAGSAQGTGPEVLPSAQKYIDKIAHFPYKIMDEDWEAMRTAGLSEDQIFEVTVSAALGAARKRLDIGLGVLGGGSDK